AVGPEMKIFVDCGMSDGYDVYKALALGADAVCTGSAIVEPLEKEGTAGVIEKIRYMNGQLMNLMEMTNVRTLDQMTAEVLHIPTF
ncbi:MAG: alpha-hydroxy-acid oxidizing protein, partial [Lachnospiraceae bacterium]|nr:alpha-hydroxy-acid oxidizing protein [Lachnospiraceae bacterium]